ncbi:MAG: methyltransferase domain-containing protein, partial [Chloroflexi bacterium]|nr:methyltransferase domain-containing protein [Chloroflexota bacterium]
MFSANSRRRPGNFGPVAHEYEKYRSQYPRQIGTDVVDAASIRAPARVLEIGSGTGRATRLFTGRGFDITCLEPVPEMFEVARALNGEGAG